MTSALAEFPNRLVAPDVIDDHAEAFHQLELDLEESRKQTKAAQKLLSDREAELIYLVRRFGGSHAQKSKILHGIVWEMVATFSQYTVQDAAAVERFRQELVKAKKTQLMKKLFQCDVRWTMRSGAAEIIRGEKLPPRLLAMLALCSDTQDKKPSLDVRQKKKTA